MVRRSFRFGLRLGLLAGVVAAVVKTVQSMRSAQDGATVTAPSAPAPAPTPTAAWPPVRTAAPERAPEPAEAPVAEAPHKVEHEAVMSPGETQAAPAEVKPADEVVPPPAKQPRPRKAGTKKASAPVQPPPPPVTAPEPAPEPEAKKAAKAPKKAATAKAPAKAPAKKAAKKAAKATPEPVSTEPWVAPQGTFCPPSHPIKAKLSSRIFHLPGMFAYPRTAPDRCYAREEDAIEDGLTKAKR